MATIATDKTAPAERPAFGEFVGLMAAVMAMVALAIDSMLPALPAIGEALGVANENHRQFVIASFMLGFGVSQFFCGTLSDRFGRKPILMISIAAYTLFGLMAAAAPSFELLIAARFMQGAAAAGGRVLVVSIVRDRYVGRQMARVMSLAFIVFLAAPVIAPSIGQMILAVAPWRWIFIALAIAGVLVAIWAGTRLPETLAPAGRMPLTFDRLRESHLRVLRNRPSTGYTVASAFMTGAMMSFINSVQQVFADVFNAPGLLAPVFAAVASTMALASLLNSRLVVRLGMRFISHWAMIGFALISAIHVAVVAMGFETLLGFVLLQGAAMGCFALAAANFGALAMEQVGDVAGTASSLQGAFSTIFGAVIGVTVGQLFDGTALPLYIGVTLCGLCTIIAVLVTERGRLFQHGTQPA
jgi:DHA1 family bicyclomycin/chloramphenicol resistance-like MFS transporter